MRQKRTWPSFFIRRIALVILLVSAPLLVFGQGGAENLALRALVHWVASGAHGGESTEEVDAVEEEALSELRAVAERRRNGHHKREQTQREGGIWNLWRARLVADRRLRPPPNSAPRPILYRHLIRRLN